MRALWAFSFLFIQVFLTNAGGLDTENPVFEFTCGEMHGFVRPIAHHHGLVIYGPGNQPVTRQGGCTLNLEHYVAAGERHGQFVPRNVELQSYELGDNAVTIRFAPTEEWKIHSSIHYDFRSDKYIDAEFTFRFEDGYPGFEAFIASYMHSRVPPLVKMNGLWLRLQPERQWQMFLPKTQRHGELVLDGRWGWFTGSLRPKLVDAVYDLPVLVTRDEDSEYALIQLVDPRECMALSPNNFAPAHDLSLVGRDVKAGDVITIPVRLHYQKIRSLDEVEALYKTFCEEKNIPKAESTP